LHNRANHFVAFYLCKEYWTLLDPLYPAETSYPALETQLHNALLESFFLRRFPPPTLPSYMRVERIAVQDDDPLPA
jgi:hypothetical protein